jgi:CheY-like chemotaxis protein
LEDACAGYCVNQAVKVGEGFEAFRSIPVLMVSSIPVDPAERFSRASEVQMVTPDAYLTKPLDVPQLLSTVKDLLASRAGM